MPPEAILQRPSVLKHVLLLLHPADSDSSLPRAALKFLSLLVHRLKRALGMALDPDLVPSSSGALVHLMKDSQLHTVSAAKKLAIQLAFGCAASRKMMS